MTPLILCALGLLVCYRANVWNIGAEGQLIVGALAGGVVALQASPEASQLYMIWVILAAMVGGALYAGIVAWLKDKCNANEILVSLMLVYIAELSFPGRFSPRCEILRAWDSRKVRCLRWQPRSRS